MGADDEETPWFAELVKERGYDSYDLSAAVRHLIFLWPERASKSAKM
jgi:hypothetical protein